MKKIIAFVLAGLFVTAAAFCDPGVNMSAGAGATASLILKPYVYADVNVDYEFENGIALGGGVKNNVNILNPKNKDGEFLESFCYVSPYIMFKYKYFTAEAGFCLQSDTENPFQNCYVHLGSDIPVWQAGKGKIGFDVGLEGWVSLSSITSDDPNASSQLGAGLGTLFTTLFNTIKVNAGVKYYLPF